MAFSTDVTARLTPQRNVPFTLSATPLILLRWNVFLPYVLKLT
jgi:hypothetical protein